ncbi:hypothetical protein EKN76_22005 [Enterobacter bugandensis]|uniref:hypothetical protein n=1 Tax=Enterobacter bugandensis TaxID=881260 RepID=UPI000F83D63F|nr:hypothetical protein [Enterobacter bugandensis]RTO08516.1 hypothetical protein EKN76_22005 [Enterobacter bugandensis]
MSERMLSAIQTVEKGGRPVFPLMPFSAFPEYMALLRKALEKKETKALIPRFYVSTSKSIIKALINMHSFEIQLSPIG